MSNAPETQKEWDTYVHKETELLLPLLRDLGFSLDDEQPHTGGERYLQQAMTTESGMKLILLGREEDGGARVVIKATRDANGARELRHERLCREELQRIDFAYQTFRSPREILFTTTPEGFTIFIQEFLETSRPFIERTTEEQFDLALKAFKAQEGARATTYKHQRDIKHTFGKKDARDYVRTFREFTEGVTGLTPEDRDLHSLLAEGADLVKTHERTIEQYGDFLTHTDFVPHNFRVVGHTIYLLDHSSIRFGNKHEGWARFINFMELYNPPLAAAFVEYVRNNRAHEELLSLKLMRVYRLGEIIYYYAQALKKSGGDLHDLNQARIALWSTVLRHVLDDTPVPPDIIKSYTQKRDSLRSPDEKKRQIGLH